MIKTAVKKKLEQRPRLFTAVLRLKRLRHWSRRWIVSSRTEITIEGYPRSGNSFAQAAFCEAQGRTCRIATHVHSYAQIFRSVQLAKPTMVLLRRPEEACLSLVALGAEQGNKDLETDGGRATAARYFARTLYEKVLEVRDQVIIAEFSQVISDFGEVIRRVNQRYGTHFRLYRNSDENDAGVFERGGNHLSPNSERDAIKQRLAHLLERDDFQTNIKAATAVYEQVLAVEQAQAARAHPSSHPYPYP